jgi:hypothetical protein
MRFRIAPLAIGLVLLIAAGCSGIGKDTATGTSAEQTDLFVVIGASGSLDGSTLTLHDVPSVVYFSDRPERKAGHITVDEYVTAWNSPDGVNDPPNADLSVFDPEGDINAVVELLSVSGSPDALVFEIKLLEGELPNATFGPVALFVDTCDITYPLCEPL